MPFDVYTLSKKQQNKGKLKPHIEIKKGERIWTSHIFETRNDKYPDDTNKNWICKFLAKEKTDGNLYLTVVWLYPNAGFYKKYEIKDCTKLKYEEMMNDFESGTMNKKHIHHEVIFPMNLNDINLGEINASYNRKNNI